MQQWVTLIIHDNASGDTRSLTLLLGNTMARNYLFLCLIQHPRVDEAADSRSTSHQKRGSSCRATVYVVEPVMTRELLDAEEGSLANPIFDLGSGRGNRRRRTFLSQLTISTYQSSCQPLRLDAENIRSQNKQKKKEEKKNKKKQKRG